MELHISERAERGTVHDVKEALALFLIGSVSSSPGISSTLPGGWLVLLRILECKQLPQWPMYPNSIIYLGAKVLVPMYVI